MVSLPKIKSESYLFFRCFKPPRIAPCMRSFRCAIITDGARPYGQAVKTPPSHGGIRSSILLRVTKNEKPVIAADSNDNWLFQ